jgi:hypothetical protein
MANSGHGFCESLGWQLEYTQRNPMAKPILREY